MIEPLDIPFITEQKRQLQEQYEKSRNQIISSLCFMFTAFFACGIYCFEALSSDQEIWWEGLIFVVAITLLVLVCAYFPMAPMVAAKVKREKRMACLLISYMAIAATITLTFLSFW